MVIDWVNRKVKTIKALPAVDRLREKLIAYGPERLSITEPIAVLLRTGGEGKSVLDLASLIARKVISIGSVDQSMLHPREVFEPSAEDVLVIKTQTSKN